MHIKHINIFLIKFNKTAANQFSMHRMSDFAVCLCLANQTQKYQSCKKILLRAKYYLLFRFLFFFILLTKACWDSFCGEFDAWRQWLS